MTLLNLLNYELSWHDREKWNKAIHLIDQFSEKYGAELVPVREIARMIRCGINEVDGFIQQNTAEVCPSCEKVCCINKHGYYDYEDLIYIFMLGCKPPVYKEGVLDTEPCQFISEYGCTIERSIRPFRCNWYFCDALLENIEKGPAKPYRAFIKRFDEVIDLRKEMLDYFFKAMKYLI